MDYIYDDFALFSVQQPRSSFNCIAWKKSSLKSIQNISFVIQFWNDMKMSK